MRIALFLDFPILPPLAPQRNFPACHRAGLYHPGIGCNSHIGDKLYSLGRAKVFSSVATNFGASSIIKYYDEFVYLIEDNDCMDRVKRIWCLSPMRAAKVQASLRIRAVSSEPSLLAHTSSESRGTFRQKARSLAPLNGWACAVKICHDGMLEDTNSLDGAHIGICS